MNKNVNKIQEKYFVATSLVYMQSMGLNRLGNTLIYVLAENQMRRLITVLYNIQYTACLSVKSGGRGRR